MRFRRALAVGLASAILLALPASFPADPAQDPLFAPSDPTRGLVREPEQAETIGKVFFGTLLTKEARETYKRFRASKGPGYWVVETWGDGEGIIEPIFVAIDERDGGFLTARFRTPPLRKEIEAEIARKFPSSPKTGGGR